MDYLEVIMDLVDILGQALLAIQVTIRVISFFKKKNSTNDEPHSNKNNDTK
jgi:hypothetical protein